MVILVIKDPSKGRGPKELLDQPFKIILPHFINRRSPSRGKREDGNQPCCQYHLCYLDIFIISLSVTSDAIFSLIPTCPSPLEYNSFKIGPNRKIVLKAHRLAEWIQKQDPYTCCLQETHFRSRDTYRLKVRG